eukprot:2558070-Rhodomonas_salina.2
MAAQTLTRMAGCRRSTQPSPLYSPALAAALRSWTSTSVQIRRLAHGAARSAVLRERMVLRGV